MAFDIPIPAHLQSIPIPSNSHFCDYSHSHSHAADRNIMHLLAIFVKKNKSAKNCKFVTVWLNLGMHVCSAYNQ